MEGFDEAPQAPPAHRPTDTPPDLGLELGRLQSQVARNDAEIEALQGALASRPWYREIGPIVSMTALLLTFSTTYYSCRQAESQQIHEARVELRGLLQRLSELPKENVALPAQYDDPFVIGQISSFIQQENKLLATHAAELMAQLNAADTRQLTTSDYILVASAMFNSGLIGEGLMLLDQAEGVIRDGQDGATIYRTKAIARFQMGDVAGGRADFGRALLIFNRFPAGSPYVEASTHAQTEMQWAIAEMNVGMCNEARQHLRAAPAHLAPFVNPSLPSPLLDQIRLIEAQVASCGAAAGTQARMGMQISPLVGPLLDLDRTEGGK